MLVLLLAGFNGLHSCGADSGNECLEAETKEKFYMIAGPGFGDRRSCDVIQKEFFRLRTSSLR